MVFMAMGDGVAPEFLFSVQEVLDIGNDLVDTEVSFLGEENTCIDGNDVVSRFVDHEVATNVAGSAKGQGSKECVA